ncbi:MAG: hypothetical protein AB7G06_05500 [Bdellovibrionales bacterium]
MFTTLTDIDGNPVSMADLAAARRGTRRSPECYYPWLQRLPLKGDPVDPKLIKYVTRNTFTKSGVGSYARRKDTLALPFVPLGPNNGWKPRVPCPAPLLQAVAKLRPHLCLLDQGLNEQTIHTFQRRFDANRGDVVGGGPHVDCVDNSIAITGAANAFCNIVDPQAVAAAGLKMEDFGLRVADLRGMSYDDVAALKKKLRFHMNDHDMCRQIAREAGVKWHTLMPNHWYLISDNMPHAAGCLSRQQIAALPPKLAKSLVTTINCDFSFANLGPA